MICLSKSLVRNRAPTCIEGDIFPSPYMKHKGISPPYLLWYLGQSPKAKSTTIVGAPLGLCLPVFNSEGCCQAGPPILYQLQCGFFLPAALRSNSKSPSLILAYIQVSTHLGHSPLSSGCRAESA